eukprot:Skav217124  [mRNA]  locus=scaffold783:366307:368610:- [translate_table: standard]
MAIPSKFSIYTDHGLSDDEIERTPLQDTCGSSSAAGEIGEEVPTVPEDQATPHDAAKVLRTGQAQGCWAGYQRLRVGVHVVFSSFILFLFFGGGGGGGGGGGVGGVIVAGGGVFFLAVDQVRLGILDVTIAERPLYAELTLGGLERCMQSSVPGRPSWGWDFSSHQEFHHRL